MRSRYKAVPEVSRPRVALVSYIALIVAAVGCFVLVVLFPAVTILQTLLGLIFVLLGLQLAYFRNEHARIWERWGEPSATVFAFTGIFFVAVGFLFAF